MKNKLQLRSYYLSAYQYIYFVEEILGLKLLWYQKLFILYDSIKPTNVSEIKSWAKVDIEKHTLKKPNLEGDGYDDNGEIILDTWICPNCDSRYEIDYDDYAYCPICGQAIDRTEIKKVKGE